MSYINVIDSRGKTVDFLLTRHHRIKNAISKLACLIRVTMDKNRIEQDHHLIKKSIRAI